MGVRYFRLACGLCQLYRCMPPGKVLAALAGAVVGSCVGPLVQGGLDETFGFSVGSRGIGPSSDMPQFQSSAQFFEAFRAVAGAVEVITRVKATPIPEVAQGVEQGATGAVCGFVGLDASKAHSRVIVNGHMHVFPSGSCGVLPPVSGDPMSGTHETPEPLDVQVQQVARMGVDVTARRNRRVQMGQSVQSGLLDDPAHRAVRHRGSSANLSIGAPGAAQGQNRCTLRLRGAMRAAERTRRTIPQTCLSLRAIPGQPLVGRAHADPGGLRGFLDAKPLVNDAQTRISRPFGVNRAFL